MRCPVSNPADQSCTYPKCDCPGACPVRVELPPVCDGGADPLEAAMDAALALVRAEALRAMRKHGPMHSAHEAWGVIDEEWTEWKDEVIANNHANQRTEAVQCAAMFVRFLIDVRA